MEYCIWCWKYGKMDVSEDWGKLFDIINSPTIRKQYPYTTFHIIPNKSEGKGQFMSHVQQRQKIKELEIIEKKQHIEMMSLLK